MANPTAGKKIASVNAQSSNQFMSRLPLTEDGEREGDEPDRGEKHERITLHATRLQRPEQATGLIRFLCDSIDRSIDHKLVDVAIHHTTEHGRALAGAID